MVEGIRRLADIERETIEAAMRTLNGSKPMVAKALGISLKTLYNKLERYRTAEHPQTCEA